MNLFYTPDITTPFYTLDETESKHCIRVLRLKENDEIFLIDGKGGFYKAKITGAHQKHCAVEIVEEQKNFGKKDYHLHIAIAPTKNNDRLEWFLEKCTEIGIDEITPIITYHSERKVIKHERLMKIIISAVKQSQKAYVPILNEAILWKDFIKKSNEFSNEKYIAHCYKEEKKELSKEYLGQKNILIAIGPEGDFSIEEVEDAIENNFTPVSLGNSRLRTETAGVVACHTVVLINDLKTKKI